MSPRPLIALDDVPTLALFVEVVASGSLSGAARRRGMTTSAVSKRLAQLERRLGVRLMNRTTRRIALTDAGLQLQRHAERVLGALQAAEVELMELGRAPRGVLRVATSVSFGQLHIGALASEFVAARPEVSVELSLEESYVDLVAGRFDVAVRCGRPADSALVARKLAPTRRLVCGSPAYFARHGVPQTPADLADHNCLRHGFEGASRLWRFASPDGAPLAEGVTGSLSADNPLVLRDAALRGVGLTMLPNFVIVEQVRAGQLRVVLEDFALDTGMVYAVYPPGPQPSRLVRAFVDLLAARLPDMLASA